MSYITIKEAVKRYNKSLSTIKRLIQVTPKEHLKDGPKLNTGKNLTLIDSKYLDEHYDHKPEPSNDLNSELIKTLQRELENKQKTIDSLLHNQSQLIENEERFQILLERSNQRAELLEQHFNKNKDKDQPTELEDIIEDAIEYKQVTKESTFINANDDASFNEWLQSLKG